eukprot:79954-Rhodomonas_salina.1
MAGCGEGLAYEWTCALPSGLQCRLSATQAVASFGTASTASLDLSALDLGAAPSIVLGVTVSKGERFASASVSLALADEPVANVLIVWSGELAATDSSGAVRVDAQNGRLVLWTDPVEPGSSFKWDVVGPGLDTTSGAVAVTQANGFASGLTSAELALNLGDMAGLVLGGRYTVSVQVTLPSGLRGVAGMTVSVNRPPSGGQCAPQLTGSERALMDAIEIGCEDWWSDMLPVSYQ